MPSEPIDRNTRALPTEADLERARELAKNAWWHQESGEGDGPKAIAQALADARAEEREACAEIAEEEGMAHRLRDDPQRMDACHRVAREIRARGESKP